MTYTISVTEKNQIHIPLGVRKMLNLPKISQVEMEVLNSAIIIKPIKPTALLNLAGKYKSKNKFNAENIRDHIDYSNL